MSNRTFLQHWPVVLLGIVVLSIFVVVLVVFQVKETEHAVVMTFGQPKMAGSGAAARVHVYSPGLHMKWPYPVDSVWRHDNRLQCYELKRGQVEQVQTADQYQIIVTTYVLWKVGEPGLFLKRVNTTAEAENKLDDVVRNSRSIVLGRHNLTELINVDPTQVNMAAIEKEILDHLHEIAMTKYGIDVVFLGFKHLGFPEGVSTKVFARMQAERNRKSEEYRTQGKRDAQMIQARADLQASTRIATAETEAKGIRAEGDRAAAEYYAVFRSHPELAAFLRKLDALRRTLSEKSTLVLDTHTPPYDLLLPGATDLEKGKAPTAPVGPVRGEAK